MEAVTVRGLEKGVHLGVRGEFGGNGLELGMESGWERRVDWLEEEVGKRFRLHQCKREVK